MGYEINYGAGQDRRFITGRSLLWSMALFAVFCLLVTVYWEDGRQVLQTIFFPGDFERAKLAGEDLVNALRGGESVSDAISAFCREIITHGG